MLIENNFNRFNVLFHVRWRVAERSWRLHPPARPKQSLRQVAVLEPSPAPPQRPENAHRPPTTNNCRMSRAKTTRRILP
ncbi:unnamed protein product, partial [Iphiclides podalirius]